MGDTPNQDARNAVGPPLQAGRFDRAASLLEQQAEEGPLNAGQLTQLGYCYTMLGRAAEAEQPFREAARQSPGVQTLSNLGNLLRLTAKYAEAAEATERALALDPTHADARNNLALIYRQLGRHAEAVSLLESLASSALENLLELSINHRMLRQPEKALEYAQLAFQQGPGNPDALLQLAISLEANEQRDAAIGHLEKAAMLAPQNGEIMTQWAHLLELSGKVEDSARICQDIEDRGLSSTLSGQVRARLQFREKNYREAIRILDGLDRAGSDWQLDQQILSLYGKCHDKLGRYEQAWSCFSRAGELGRRHAGNPRLLELFFDQLGQLAEGAATPPGENRAAGEGPRSNAPVFIVGLPRSGTTLLGYLLGKQAGMTVLDEERLFFTAALRVLGGNSAEKLLGMNERQAAEIAGHYWALAREKGYVDGRTLVDKDPLNLVNVEIIGRVFPQARFICVSRHPCDVALSIFMQNFAERSVLAQCNTMSQAALFCRAVLDAWEAIARRADIELFRLHYEDFVTDPERHLEAMTRWCGGTAGNLDAESGDDILARIRTPSYLQISEPVNRGGVGRWKHYQAFMQPEVLQPLAGLVSRHERASTDPEPGT